MWHLRTDKQTHKHVQTNRQTNRSVYRVAAQLKRVVEGQEYVKIFLCRFCFLFLKQYYQCDNRINWNFSGLPRIISKLKMSPSITTFPISPRAPRCDIVEMPSSTKSKLTETAGPYRY